MRLGCGVPFSYTEWWVEFKTACVGVNSEDLCMRWVGEF